MGRGLIEVGGCANDFVLKELDLWEDDLGRRLTERLLPRSPAELLVVVPAFDAQRVWVGGVWVLLKPMSFAIVDALASGLPGFLPRYWWQGRAAQSLQGVALQVPRKRLGIRLTLDELKMVMCRREVTDLRADFMEKFGEKQLRSHLREIEAALDQAFADHGLVVDAGAFIETTRVANDLGLRLMAPSRVCETPEEFFVAQRSPLRLLVVEDDPGWRATIVKELERLGECEIDQAASYEQAVQVATRSCPDLVSLDLCIPRDGVATPENGTRLRRELARASAGTVKFVVLTAHDLPSLRKELSRSVPLGGTGRAPEALEAFGRVHRWVQTRSVILKQPGAEKQLFIEAWRAERERFSRGLVLETPARLHDLQVDITATWGLTVDGKRVKNTARGKNRKRDQALVKVLALYAGVPLRSQALLDYWLRLGLLEGEIRPRDRLAHRVKHLRKSISGTGANGHEVLVGYKDGYALVGAVRIVGDLSP